MFKLVSNIYYRVITKLLTVVDNVHMFLVLVMHPTMCKQMNDNVKLRQMGLLTLGVITKEYKGVALDINDDLIQGFGFFPNTPQLMCIETSTYIPVMVANTLFIDLPIKDQQCLFEHELGHIECGHLELVRNHNGVVSNFDWECEADKKAVSVVGVEAFCNALNTIAKTAPLSVKWMVKQRVKELQR